MISFKRLSASSCLLILMLLMWCAPYVSAQAPPPVRVPRPSQKASVMQTIGVTDLTITYSRPGVKGRRIWGDPLPSQAVKGEATLDDQNLRPKDAPIVPWGHAWRTGANEATQFVVSDDVLINGQKLPAGSYSLHTIPTKDEWTIIFNSDANQWGSFNYDAAKDTLRVKVKPEWVNENQEWLAYSFDPVTDNSAQVNIRWEKVRVPFKVEVADVKALTIQKARAAVAAGKPDDWRSPLQAANYVFLNDEKGDHTEALAWLEQSIKIKETFQNLYTKARVLAGQGKTQEAIATGEKALALGKAAKNNTADLEKRLAEWKAKKT
jgi:ribosomal protein S4